MIRPDETGTYPSQDLEWQDLDTALLVLVVSPLGEVRMWAEDATAYPAHAAMLRSFANRLDPDEDRIEGAAAAIWDHFQADRHHRPGETGYVSWADSPEQHRPWWRRIARAALGIPQT